MDAKSPSHDRIELRSPKVRRTIGKIPSSLVWAGIIVIVAISIALISALILIPHPYGNGESLLRYFLQR